MNIGYVALKDLHSLIRLNRGNGQLNLVIENNPVLRYSLRHILEEYFVFNFKGLFNATQRKAFQTEVTDKINVILDTTTSDLNAIDFSSLHGETHRLYFDEGGTLFLDANYAFIDMSIFYTLLAVVFLFLKYPAMENIEIIIKFIK
jgi:hypothetical protein